MTQFDIFNGILNDIPVEYWAGLAIFVLVGCFPTFLPDLLIYIISWCSDVTLSLSNNVKRTLLNILTSFVLVLSLVFFMIDFSTLQAKIEKWKEPYTANTLDVPDTLSGRVGRRFSRAMSIAPPSPSMMRL